jgi:septum formation protein
MNHISDKATRTNSQGVHSIWLPETPLILASRSNIRSAMLHQALIPHETKPARLNERAIEDRGHFGSTDVTQLSTTLAQLKALAVSKHFPDHFVLGSDQTCTLYSKQIHKPANSVELKSQLMLLRGKTHILASAAAIAKGGKIIEVCASIASLTMRNASDSFLDTYISLGGDDLLQCVGGYQIENQGCLLMSEIKGDMYTIMGMPLLSILDQFRRLGLIPT